jgi:hypothetical protein
MRQAACLLHLSMICLIAPSSPISLASGTEDQSYTIQASDLLQGFSDIDGDSLSVINLSSSSGFLQDNQDGTYTLTPNANFNGNIGLTYQVSDSNGGVVDAQAACLLHLSMTCLLPRLAHQLSQWHRRPVLHDSSQ